MAPVMVSASTGAMNSVLFKLNHLLRKEYKMQKTMRREVNLLLDELPSMLGLLEKLSDTEDLDSSVKRWASQVREMTYDLEDTIDPFMYSIDQGNPHLQSSSFVREALRKVKLKLGRRRSTFYQQLRELRARFQEASERRARYRLDNIDDAATSRWRAVISVDPRLTLLRGVSNNDSLVGIDRRGDKLIELLADDQPRLKIVAIVGMGGSGKTTLARNAYERLEEKFEYRAFVSVSRNPHIMEILQHILLQVGAVDESIIATTARSTEQLVRTLQNFLFCKRFLIVTDDIWSTSNWRIIKTALPENDCGCRILMTTRDHHVAHSCCYPDEGHIFRMELLTDTEALTLFSRRLFGSGERCPPHLAEISREIMSKCGGVPLAINCMASLLAATSSIKEFWEKIRNSFVWSLYKDAGTEIMSAINLSYIDLSSHLKTCLLYLSMFPEHHLIDRKQLVRRWIAEGFIEEHGESSIEVGENYFNELLNRNLVQLMRIQYDNRVDACQVHDIILDFIVSKSAEENFAIRYGDNNEKITGLQYTIRRLSLDYRNQCDTFQPSEINTSHVRSLAVIGPNGKMLALENFRALRVLDLENFGESENHFIEGLGRLYLLKYLRLQTTSVVELPEEIGKLQYLQTLDLSGAPGIKLPKTTVQLQQLMYLLVSNVKLPDGFGRMTSLQELSCIKIDTADALQELEKLSRLKVIGLRVDVGTLVSSSHHKLSTPNLRSLYIESADGCSLDFLMDFFSIPCYELKEFQMKSSYFLPTVPNWVSSLVNVTLLCINIDVVGEEVLKILGELPSLISLILMLKSEASRQGLIIRSNGFKQLKEFELTCWNSWIKLFFEPGAMNYLEKLLVVFSAQAEHVADGFHVGLEHLTSLKHLVAKINCRGATAKDVNAAEHVIKNLITNHSNKPRIELQRHDEQHIVKDERDISVHDEEDNDQDEVSDNVEHEVVVEVFRDPTETLEPKPHQ